MPVIYNLIRSSQSLRLLINRPTAAEVEEDPYDHRAENVEDSRAAESCLWELESLRKHFVPEVKRLASRKNTLFQYFQTAFYRNNYLTWSSK